MTMVIRLPRGDSDESNSEWSMGSSSSSSQYDSESERSSRSSSSDDRSESSTLYSSDDDDDDYSQSERDAFIGGPGILSSLRRRIRNIGVSKDEDDDDDDSKCKSDPYVDLRNDMISNRKSTRKHLGEWKIWMTKHKILHTVLALSLTIWIFTNWKHKTNQGKVEKEQTDAGNFREWLRQRKEQRAKYGINSGGFRNEMRYRDHQEKASNQRVPNVEDVPEGCIASDWQKMAFPNCNDLHEIDLRQLHRKFGAINEGTEDETFQHEARYLGSGLWRDAWSLTPRREISNEEVGDNDDLSVIKIMKMEHDLDTRNFERHRRDTLTMERLTSSPNVMSIYGYCGNTVLTERAEIGLDEYISSKRLSSQLPGPDRDTPRGRLELSLQAARGVAAMHSVDGGPIIHADLQAKQFLVNKHGTIKINDFNRCRFLPHKANSMNETCPIRIPSAPGLFRSPEEYEYRELNEQLDVYSLGNVLYSILTGVSKPWGDQGVSRTKKRIANGDMPSISESYHDTDESLVHLIHRAYERDPARRIRAVELVSELEKLLESRDAAK